MAVKKSRNRSGIALVFDLFLFYKTVHLQLLRGMQSSKLGMYSSCSGYVKEWHLSIEATLTGYLSAKNGILKGKGLDLPAGPSHIKLCRVPPRRNTRSHVVCNQYATRNSSNETVTKQSQISHRNRTLFYSRRFKKPEERICPICKIEMEDE